MDKVYIKGSDCWKAALFSLCCCVFSDDPDFAMFSQDSEKSKSSKQKEPQISYHIEMREYRCQREG